MHLIFSHNLTDEQKADAIKTLGTEEFIYLPNELQQKWSNVPPDLERLNDFLSPIITYLKTNVRPNDYVLVQGDFGATYITVNFVKQLQATPIYATTKRQVIEVIEQDKIIKKSIFKHERFRKYE